MPDMRGRRRTPTDLHLVRGNPGNKALPKNEPKPQKGVPPMPARVEADPLAAAKWRELVELTTLPGAYVLTLASGPMLEIACLAYARSIRAEEKGHWSQVEKWERAYERRISHFGLSPALSGKVERQPEEPSGGAAGRHFR